MVTVKIFGYLTAAMGMRDCTMSCGTVRDLLEELGEKIPSEARVHLQDPKNGQFRGFHLVINEKSWTLAAALDRELVPGDVVWIISPVAGG